MARQKTRPPRKKDPARHHHGDLAPALVETAWRLLQEEGVSAVTIREVARRVGVTPMATYYHFEDKSALMAALAERGFEELRKAMAERMSREKSPLLKLRAMGISYAVFSVRHPEAFRLMFGSDLAAAGEHASLAAAAGRTMDLVVGSFRDASASGAIAPVDARDAALTAWSAVHGLATLLVAGVLGPATEANATALAETVTEGLRRGLRLTPA